jgi:hypothetical protein
LIRTAIGAGQKGAQGQWPVEKFDGARGCEVKTFTGPDARKQAIYYARVHYDSFIVKRRLEPYWWRR